MFKGFQRIKLSKFSSFEDSVEKLDFLGVPENIGEKSAIFRKSEMFYSQKTSVTLYQKSKSDVFLQFEYDFNPNLIAWLLGICFFPLGFLIFIIPNNEKNDFSLFLSNHKL